MEKRSLWKRIATVLAYLVSKLVRRKRRYRIGTIDVTSIKSRKKEIHVRANTHEKEINEKEI